MTNTSRTRRAPFGRNLSIALAALLASVGIGCASSDDVVTAGRSEAAGSGLEPDAQSTKPGPTEGAGLLFAGLPLGSSDVFDAPTSARDLVASAAATVSGSVVGHQILQDPELTSLGYSGPGGVVRLQVEVDAMYGPTTAVASVAGESKPIINVDYPNWITGSAATEFSERLEKAVAARPPVFLILRVGTTDGERATGAYTPVWVPLGVLDVVDGRLSAPSIDREMVERDAVARGEGRTSPTVDDHVDEKAADSAGESTPPVLDALIGRSLEEVAKLPGIEGRPPVGGADLQAVLDRN